ncbi:MAG: hypothetical protein IMZ55_04590 [Acidobacteria bacterium]|nr:hypothetical protein [Acidobacteriota bacterium]
MSLVTFKQPIDRFHGSVMDFSGSGLVIYGSAKAGNIARKYVVPFNPGSALQDEVRNNFTAAAQAFRGLSANVAASWNTAAVAYSRLNPLEVPYGYSGINLYMAINAYRELAGEAITDTPPTDLRYPVIDTAATIATAPVADNAVMIVTLSALVSPPATVDQHALIMVTPDWVLTARHPRRSDFAMRNVTTVVNNIANLPYSGGIAVVFDPASLTNDAKLVKSGDTVWFRVMPLSAEFVPAPSAIEFSHVLTTTA